LTVQLKIVANTKTPTHQQAKNAESASRLPHQSRTASVRICRPPIANRLAWAISVQRIPSASDKDKLPMRLCSAKKHTKPSHNPPHANIPRRDQSKQVRNRMVIKQPPAKVTPVIDFSKNCPVTNGLRAEEYCEAIWNNPWP